MDVNSINNNISSLNSGIQHNQVDRSASAGQIDSNDEFLKLSIADYNKKRDELSASLQAFNEGIGVSTIAQNGLQRQEEILTNIQNTLTQLSEDKTDTQDKNLIKNQLNKDLLNFREEAFQTKYKNENIIAIDDYEENLTINISTKEAYFSIDKPSTPDIASQVAQAISKSDFNNPEELASTIDGVENGIEQLQNIQAQFQDLNENLKASAKESINEQITLSNQNRVNKEVNFPKEVSDFSKTNVNANAGYLAASQANIIQEQSVRLLS